MIQSRLDLNTGWGFNDLILASIRKNHSPFCQHTKVTVSVLVLHQCLALGNVRFLGIKLVSKMVDDHVIDCNKGL